MATSGSRDDFSQALESAMTVMETVHRVEETTSSTNGTGHQEDLANQLREARSAVLLAYSYVRPGDSRQSGLMDGAFSDFNRACARNRVLGVAAINYESATFIVP